MLVKILIGLVFLALIVILGTKLYLGSQLASSFLQSKKMTTVKQTSTPVPIRTIGWIPYWDQKAAVESFYKNVDLFDFVSVFWYRIDASGNLSTYKSAVTDQSIIDFAHQNKVKVMAVVANLPDYEEGGDWDWQRVDMVISTADARTKHVNALLKLVQEKNLDGIDIDYEALKEPQRENFSLFIEELAQKFHQEGKLIGVAIHPKTSETNPDEDNGSHAQDLVRIAKAADQLYFMTYTQNFNSSQPGSVGSVNWAKNVMAYAIDNLKVPPAKIFFGIGLFGLEWQETGNGSFESINDDLTFGKVQTIIQTFNPKVEWDQSAKSSYFDYFKNGQKYVIWFENNQSVLERIELAKKFGVGNLAFWRLGGEDPQVWEKVRELKKTNKNL